MSFVKLEDAAHPEDHYAYWCARCGEWITSPLPGITRHLKCGYPLHLNAVRSLSDYWTAPQIQEAEETPIQPSLF